MTPSSPASISSAPVAAQSRIEDQGAMAPVQLVALCPWCGQPQDVEIEQVGEQTFHVLVEHTRQQVIVSPSRERCPGSSHTTNNTPRMVAA